MDGSTSMRQGQRPNRANPDNRAIVPCPLPSTEDPSSPGDPSFSIQVVPWGFEVVGLTESEWHKQIAAATQVEFYTVLLGLWRYLPLCDGRQKFRERVVLMLKAVRCKQGLEYFYDTDVPGWVAVEDLHSTSGPMTFRLWCLQNLEQAVLAWLDN